MSAASIEVHVGPAVVPHLDEVARLRITVFRAFPYLYDGDVDYERDYLIRYASSPESVFVLARDGDRIVGASTGIPLEHDGASLHAPFLERGLDVGGTFYFGESVLLPSHRGLKLGHAFFDAREAHARALGRFRRTAFCAVDRDAGDPRRPRDHRDNDAFWSKRGYTKQPGMRTSMRWRELGSDDESDHALTFWLRELEASP